MTLEHTPPQLSSEGARLLTDVLAARSAQPLTPVLERTDHPTNDVEVMEPSETPDAPIHPMTVLLPVLVVLGGLLTAAVLSFGLGGQSGAVDSVDVEVAGVVEERVQGNRPVDATLLSIETPNAGILRFDLRLAAIDLSAPVAADDFDVEVVDQAGNPVTTIVRLPSGDLGPSSFIDVMVRVEGAGSTGNVVSILLDGVVVEQLLLD